MSMFKNKRAGISSAVEESFKILKWCICGLLRKIWSYYFYIAQHTIEIEMHFYVFNQFCFCSKIWNVIKMPDWL
jgi:hypothetical protein